MVSPAPVLDLEDRYFRLADLARYSTLSVRQLQRYITDPVDPLPVHHLGRQVLVQKSEFDAWLRNRRECAAAAAAPDPRGQLSATRRAALALRGYRLEKPRKLPREETAD